MAVQSPKIIPFLWYDGKAEESAAFYVSLFKDSKILKKQGPVVEFEIQGQKFCALNGGPHYKFTPAVSLQVLCDDQAEIDRLWSEFGKDGGKPIRCGWIEDKYGLSWQIIPRILPELLADSDANKAESCKEAMLRMDKMDISALKAAHGGS